MKLLASFVAFVCLLVVHAAGAQTTWNPADKGSKTTLSNANRVASGLPGGPVGFTSARGTTSKIEGYFEAILLTASPTASVVIGVADGSNTCSTKLVLRLSSDASRNITGLSCGQVEGDIRILHNVGAQSIVLKNQDANSTAANRFLFGGDITLAADSSLQIRYDDVADRWRAVVNPGGGGGGGGTVTSASVAAGVGIAVSGTCTITTSGTCTVSLEDSYRQSILLDRIYQSKLYGGVRRVIHSTSDGFKATDGINAGSSSNYNADTANGKIAPTTAFDANTTMLLHFDGANGATTTTDATGTSRTFTFSNSSLATGQSKFGGGSSTYNGTGTNSLLSVSDSADFDLGSGDFTVDFWVRFASVANDATGYTIFAHRGSATDLAYQFAHVNGQWRFSYSTNGTSFATTTTANHTIVANTWYHIALVRSGATTYIFADGVSLTVSNPISGTLFNSTQVFRMGGDSFNASGLNGWLDEFRVSKGLARWTSGFTPPASAYVGSPSNMTVVTTAQSSDSSISFGRVLIEYDMTDTPTLNTDLTAEVTCNNGTNWASATLSDAGTGQGRRVAETADTACTAGTSFAARLKTFNAKDVPIYGLSMTVH